MERYKRRTFSFDQAVKEMFVLGLSPPLAERTKDFFDGFFGKRVLSPQAVSLIFRKVEEELKSYRERRLSDDYPPLADLFLDGFSPPEADQASI